MPEETNNVDLSAFPTGWKEGEIAVSEGGLTKREYFAIRIMAALAADYDKLPGQNFTMWCSDLRRGEPGHAWKSSIHMPRWACRIELEIVSVRKEPFDALTEEDACREGVGAMLADHEYWDGDPDAYRKCYRLLWDSINGEGSWRTNPDVWRIEFKRIEVTS